MSIENKKGSLTFLIGINMMYLLYMSNILYLFESCRSRIKIKFIKLMWSIKYYVLLFILVVFAIRILGSVNLSENVF